MTDQNTRLEFTRLLDNRRGDIRFMLDSSVPLEKTPNGFKIIGWVIHRKSEISEIILTSGSQVLATAKLDVFRPVVSEHFKHFHNSESAGFKLVTPQLPTGIIFLKIVLKNGKTVTIAEGTLAKYDEPKLLFMHIAKAAGSTVNSFFARHYREDQYATHIESNLKWQSSPDELKNLDFLSGHISLHVLEKKLNLDEYYKVTVIREPYAQLCSHLSWIRRLSDPGEEQRFYRHPDYIQRFALKLAKVDFTNSEALKNLMAALEESEMRLVDNCQVRYFTLVPIGESVGEVHSQKAIETSKVFNAIGTTEHIGTFLNGVAKKMSWPEPEQFVHENVTSGFYGLDTSNPKIRAVLAPFVQYDQVLFDHVRQTPGFLPT